ncbi:MAG: hypothetical protein M1823_005640 [Watsoniomyces obsoletus]|nr:MAG: hypothetical protein M1823_005640 [Watsoniomyces obsoletus]
MFRTAACFNRPIIVQAAARTARPRVSFPKPPPSSYQCRAESGLGFPRPPRQQYGYNRFQRARDIKTLWKTSSFFRYGVVGAGGLGTVFYVSNLEKVPVSGRTRFNVISPEQEQQFAAQMYQQILSQFQHKMLPSWHPSSRMVQRVMDRLIPASGLNDAKWEVHVIDDPTQKNAFVIPGGKVFVFSGILPIADGEDGLAAVLGHEIAHNVAHHQAERTSQLFVVLASIWLLSFAFQIPDVMSQLVLDFGFMRPGSRAQEAEADYIGLMMMAQCCYDPKAAIDLWKRMGEAEGFAPPQWLSTHPSSHNRMEKIREWLPEAENKRAESDCRSTLDYASDFRDALPQIIW